MKQVIEAYCKELKLGSRIAEYYSIIEANTHEEFLVQLLALEVEHRRVTRKNRLLKQANFDVVKTFQGYTFDHIEFPKQLSVEELKSTKFIERKENLVLYGGVGTGKTHLATAIGVEACNQGKSVKFYRIAALVNELIEAKNTGKLHKMMNQLEKIDLLICDEWGYIPVSKEGAQLLLQVIAGCYEKRSVIINTNLEFSKWNSVFHDERLTTAIIDRLVHHSYLLTFTGTSYRLKHSYMNL
ncbi:IS21-like element helper ATPase IstB [Parageobacillus thermoglucosidasius]|uniref:ATP-binding protein n=1 Tax=Parageobacillus thermoglucosidasius TaxID=1426 RepID=A0AAN0YLM0_PARTM|nr:IS21-like element helper ATPase IstB [Parageobacillus thermoglucosidasius]ALF09309.1 ATP-binding protein [Parageobacillus thermoglucosidasius]ANZ29390.1 ATP-binding protein [Parageobacillus thermoglucosidasius]APM80129.1 ATP-binding protein [Parageobacillus thermoglucosidasius]KJX67752.1 ATP-binding protein [Parageobacillus thermoglucosidasius]RDE20705.1 ATP-binding protein [Parageobacillus thermoglucosidasius]